MMRSNVERTHDEYERMAYSAMMSRQATNAKRLKMSDLYKRPADVSTAEKDLQTMKNKVEHASEWMSQFTLFGGQNDGKEEANG